LIFGINPLLIDRLLVGAESVIFYFSCISFKTFSSTRVLLLFSLLFIFPRNKRVILQCSPQLGSCPINPALSTPYPQSKQGDRSGLNPAFFFISSMVAKTEASGIKTMPTYGTIN
jgi:hypothetical protein